jgi:hypothetical protein
VAASVTVKLLSLCPGGSIGELEARALGMTPQGLRWGDLDGSGSLDAHELLGVLKHVTAPSSSLAVSNGQVEVQLGMPGMRPDEMRWLLLPDWHYQQPFPQQLLPDYHHQLPSTVPPNEANLCTHSDARLDEIRRFLFHRNRLTPRGASRSSSYVRSSAKAQMPGGDGGDREAKALEFPFVVSLEAPTHFESHTSWTQYCAATLIHPSWVLTAAGCVADKNLASVVKNHTAVLGGQACAKGGGVETRAECAAGVTRASLARVVVHPLYQVDARYDVALIQLQEPVVGFEPAPLDDGTDLAFLPCMHPKLTAVGWWPSDVSDADKVPLRRQDLEYVKVETCAKLHLQANGYQTVDDARYVSICARPLADNASSSGSGEGGGRPGGCQANFYFGQDGGALLVPRQGTTDGYVLVGVIRFAFGAAANASDHDSSACPPDDLPRAHVRVEGIRQWVLSVSALGAAVPKRLTLDLDALHLPAHSRAALRIYAGASEEEHALLEEVDSECAAGQVSVHASSAMLLVLSNLNTGHDITNNTLCGKRVGLKEAWERDCRREHLHVRIGTRGCQEIAAALPWQQRGNSSTLSPCDDPLAGGIEGCLVSFARLASPFICCPCLSAPSHLTPLSPMHIPTAPTDLEDGAGR